MSLKYVMYVILVCHPGETRNSTTNECELCPLGTYTPRSQTTYFEHEECLHCPEGQTTTLKGSAGLENCHPGRQHLLTNRSLLKERCYNH